VEQQLSQEEQRFKLIDEQHREVRKIKHDTINHLTSIHNLLAIAQYDEAIKYLDEYLEQATTVINHSITGKPSADVLISEKIILAKDIGIDFDIKSEKLTGVQISPLHFNILLSNALDNAIEACLRLPDNTNQYISLGLKTEGDNLCIRIINSSLPIEIPDEGLPQSTKADKLRHGLGLPSIKRVAEHYGGAILCAYNEGEFTLYIQVLNRPAEI